MLKKVYTIIISAVFLICSFFTASAETQGNQIILRANTFFADGANKVNLEISTAFYASGIQFLLEYDDSLLNYLSADISEHLIPGNSSQNSVQKQKGGLRIAILGDLENGTQGVWLTLCFAVAGGAAGNTDFKLSAIKAVDASANEIECFSGNCSVEINGAVGGDVNGDGWLDVRDIIRFKKFFAYSADINTENADLNCDSDITSADMLILRKILISLS